jgi:HlyD family secretion protein
MTHSAQLFYSPTALAPFSTDSDPIASADWDDWSESTQEVLDTLPQQWSRSLIYFLVVFGAVALPWAVMSKVDEVGTARGRLEPKDKPVRLDAPTSGTVASIQVKAGQEVQAGQPLLSLKSEAIRTELQQAQKKLDGQLSQLSQLQMMQRQLTVSLQTQRLQLQAQAAEQQAERDRTAQRIQFYIHAQNLAQELLDKDTNRAERFRNLKDMGIISGVQAEDAERAMLETSQRLGQIQSDLAQTRTELQRQSSTYERIQREGEMAVLASQRQLKESQTQMLQLQSEIAATRSQIRLLQLQLQQTALKIPVSGTIFELPVENPGMVLQPGQMVATIAPKGAPLILRAQIDSSQSGFLKVGLPVKIKLDAFPFQEYGIISGKVRWISPNSRQVQTALASQEVFDVEVELSQTFVQAGGKQVRLTPGQTATAEVIIRQKRIIDYFLDPFKRLQQGGVNF